MARINWSSGTSGRGRIPISKPSWPIQSSQDNALTRGICEASINVSCQYTSSLVYSSIKLFWQRERKNQGTNICLFSQKKGCAFQIPSPNYQHEIRHTLRMIFTLRSRCNKSNLRPYEGEYWPLLSNPVLMPPSLGLGYTHHSPPMPALFYALIVNKSSLLCFCKWPVRHSFPTIQTGGRPYDNRNSESYTHKGKPSLEKSLLPMITCCLFLFLLASPKHRNRARCHESISVYTP